MFRAGSFKSPEQAGSLPAAAQGSSESGERQAEQLISQAQSWGDLETALDTAGSLQGSRLYSAAELKQQIDSIRRLNQEGILTSPNSPVFGSLTRAGGFREKVQNLVALDTARTNIDKAN
ncbi:MAG: hypothetical protein Q8N81_08480 [bacterium]|nr:hypothetical protein [bacterium]